MTDPKNSLPKNSLEDFTDQMLHTWSVHSVGQSPADLCDRVLRGDRILRNAAERHQRTARYARWSMAIASVAIGLVSAVLWFATADRFRPWSPSTTANLDTQVPIASNVDPLSSIDALATQVEIFQQKLELLELEARISRTKSKLQQIQGRMERNHTRDLAIHSWNLTQSHP